MSYISTSEDLPTRVRRLTDRLNMLPTGWHDLVRKKPGTGAWEEALAALKTDPDAAIPE